jgi:hypothetical protein
VESFRRIVEDRYPGYDIGRKLMGALFPEHFVIGNSEGARYDDELAVIVEPVDLFVRFAKIICRTSVSVRYSSERISGPSANCSARPIASDASARVIRPGCRVPKQFLKSSPVS